MAKALVVDDSRAVRMILVRTLRELGYEVREAANGREALEVIEAGEQRGKAGSGGLEHAGDEWPGFAEELRQNPELSSLAVVMVTTETEMDQMAAALEAGANEYVMKPFTQDILVEKLELAGIHP